MVTIEQLRGADHEDLVCFIADLGAILDDLLRQNSELLALVRAWQATVEMLQAGNQDAEPHALH